MHLGTGLYLFYHKVKTLLPSNKVLGSMKKQLFLRGGGRKRKAKCGPFNNDQVDDNSRRGVRQTTLENEKEEAQIPHGTSSKNAKVQNYWIKKNCGIVQFQEVVELRRAQNCVVLSLILVLIIHRSPGSALVSTGSKSSQHRPTVGLTS